MDYLQRRDYREIKRKEKALKRIEKALENQDEKYLKNLVVKAGVIPSWVEVMVDRYGFDGLATFGQDELRIGRDELNILKSNYQANHVGVWGGMASFRNPPRWMA